jgi:type I restriction enzyme S subunit
MKIGSVKSKFIYESLRLNSDFHLSQGVVYDRLIKNNKYDILGNLASDIFCAGRSKRIYVKKNYGIPYVGNTDVMATDPSFSCNYASRKFWTEKKGFLEEGLILTGRVGQNTVGSYSYVNKSLEGFVGSDNVIRIVNNGKVRNGYLFAFLGSKYGYYLSRRHISGNAQPFVTEDMLSEIPIPLISDEIQSITNELIIKAAKLRDESINLLNNARLYLLEKTGLRHLDYDDFDYFGGRSGDRVTPIFTTKKPNATSFNAFHYSPKRHQIIESVKKTVNTTRLKDVLNEKSIHSPSAVKVIPVKEGLKFINQREIFNYSFPHQIILNKNISKENLLIKGDILIAGIGTLGENEVFCRTVYVGDSLKGFLPAGNFIKLQVDNNKIYSGYLYTWLSTDYGFRLLRYTHTGTKQCILKHDFMGEIPIPLIDDLDMLEIHNLVIKAHEKANEALENERKSIDLIEKEIESWQ